MEKCDVCDHEVKKVFRYRIECKYDMGMSRGGETYKFNACSKKEAMRHIEKMEGGWLASNKRGARFEMETFSVVINSQNIQCI